MEISISAQKDCQFVSPIRLFFFVANRTPLCLPKERAKTEARFFCRQQIVGLPQRAATFMVTLLALLEDSH